MKTTLDKTFKVVVLFVACVFMSLVAAPNTSARTVVLNWQANSESNLDGYNVYYRADSSSLPFDGVDAAEGEAPVNVEKATTATITGLDPASDYYFAITAYNTYGLESGYSQIIYVPGQRDIQPPVVQLTSPADGAILTGPVDLRAVASDDVAVTKVELYANGTLLTAGNVSPMTFTNSLGSGSYTLTAKAYDAAGNVGTSSISVTVDLTAPTVSISAPATATAASVLVSANASDDIAVNKVEFYVNGALQATSTSAPYTFNWNTQSLASGSYTISAKAYDAAGNVGDAANVTVSVINDTTAPTVSFLAPASNYVYGNKISISASATDDVGVTRMELYVDNVLKYSTTSSSLNTSSNMSMGIHTITVKAYDAANNVKVASKTVNRFN